MKRNVFIAAALTIVIAAAICFVIFSEAAPAVAQSAPSDVADELQITLAPEPVVTDTIYLAKTGYFVLVPEGYYMTMNEPYPGYVSDEEDKIHPIFCFFPEKKDSVCSTRLLIHFDSERLPKTGYPKGSEFWLNATVLGKSTSFLDHATCMRPFRMRSASVMLSDSSFVKIICEAGDPTRMQELYETALSLEKKP